MVAAVCAIAAATPILGIAQQNRNAGAVFVMTNSADKNQVIAFERGPDGNLSYRATYDTEGRGSGGVNDPLQSQGSLTLSQDHSLLFAANAGSGTVSVFAVDHRNLILLDKVHSGGSEPAAIAEYRGLVYVLNKGGQGSVVGFRLDYGGKLTEIQKSTAFLSGTYTGGGSIAFSPDGKFLLVTEIVSQKIDVFPVLANGTLGPIVANPSPGPGAFALTFAPDGVVIVSETGAAGVTNGSAISSYVVLANGKLSPVSQSVPTDGAANCWNVVTPDGKRVYVSNAGTSTISGFSIGKGGVLTPIGSTVVGSNPEGATNLDIAISADGKYFYTLNSGSGNVGIFAVQPDGTLTNLGEAGDFPVFTGFNGIAAF
jgi:6-phosphogluconolactonase (cycloisomerase 2 family)